VQHYEEGEAEHTRRLEIDATEEVRVDATLQSARYLQGIRRHYDRNVQPQTFQVGDLVLRRIQKKDGQHKLLSPWEGPFIVARVIKLGSFELMTEEGTPGISTNCDVSMHKNSMSRAVVILSEFFELL
jgi:hypothetical protein